MPFVCGGHPSPASFERVLPALERAGASIVEIGFPFSDPIADGPVIAAAMHEVLQMGTTPASVIEGVARARKGGLRLGLVAMVSVSIVHRLGAERLARDASTAGFDGFIFPDAPLEEAERFIAPVREAGLTASLLIAPTTPPERARAIAKACTGFVYMLARVGITGGDGHVDVSGMRRRVAELRTVTDLPIACGFGIASPDQVRSVVAPPERDGAGADAAIVGSALVKRMGKAAKSGADPVEDAEAFVRALAAVLV